MDNSDSSQQHSWHGLTPELLKINKKMKKPPPIAGNVFHIQFSGILSDSLRIKHFDLQKLSVLTLNYWGCTFPLHRSSDS